MTLLHYFFDLTSFFRLGQKDKNIFIRFLVQMKTKKFVFEIYILTFTMNLILNGDPSESSIFTFGLIFSHCTGTIRKAGLWIWQFFKVYLVNLRTCWKVICNSNLESGKICQNECASIEYKNDDSITFYSFNQGFFQRLIRLLIGNLKKRLHNPYRTLVK